MLSILNEMQDYYFKEGKGQKEIMFMNETIRGLSNQQDMKITYANGFHVNHATTRLANIDLETSPCNQDYWSFYQTA